jgi:hypothetical protein
MTKSDKLGKLKSGNTQLKQSGADKLIFDFSRDKALKSVKISNFNNYSRDFESFHDEFKCLFKNIIHLSQYDLRTALFSAHCHQINDPVKKNLIKQVLIEQTDKTKFDLSKIDELLSNNSIYQFGATGGVRILGYETHRNVIQVLFIDLYHLIFPSEKYNNVDFDLNEICWHYGK